MAYPPLLKCVSSAEYRMHYENIYCRRPVMTFDGIAVRFRKRDFNHCFFESVSFKDDTFSPLRAERLPWIKAALEDSTSERYIGWDSAKKRYDAQRRVTLVMGNYIVVIALKDTKNAYFVTAYVAGQSTLDKIRKGPKWA